MAKILIIEDDHSIRKAMALFLQKGGHNVFEANSCNSAIKQLRVNQLDVVFCDLFVPTEQDGLKILSASKILHPQTSFLMMTAHRSIERAVAAIKAGADDFIVKGFTMEALGIRLDRLMYQRSLLEENSALTEQARRLQSELEGRYHYDEIIGDSKIMRNLKDLLTRVIPDSSSTILLQGESGTGKELLVRAIHYNGPRKEKPLIVVNCAAIPEHLLESELFGFEKGAFTGAIQSKPGKFEVADGGTVFLDEIGEISLKMQVELLRFTQDQTFERLGSNRPICVDIHIVTATNNDLETAIAEGRFRKDLYYRLNVIPIKVPTLRERKEDIPLLLDYFVERFHQKKGRKIQFSRDALQLLQHYEWPGNVRELEKLVERLVVTAPLDTILVSDLPDAILTRIPKQVNDEDLDKESSDQILSLKDATRKFEKVLLLQELEKYHWNISEVARSLNERRDTLSRKIKRYGLKET